jgi:hypothetical protein
MVIYNDNNLVAFSGVRSHMFAMQRDVDDVAGLTAFGEAKIVVLSSVTAQTSDSGFPRKEAVAEVAL